MRRIVILCVCLFALPVLSTTIFSCTQGTCSGAQPAPVAAPQPPGR
ncbi:MAG TPA: hypothetical protein VFW33_02770 [Gemmataceae bacterium]|nr:hypothetical protein [Gemmataceae bacterium]